jgi:hypothetical protein
MISVCNILLWQRKNQREPSQTIEVRCAAGDNRGGLPLGDRYGSRYAKMAFPQKVSVIALSASNQNRMTQDLRVLNTDGG